jgi:YVTN family beta-propeller protein
MRCARWAVAAAAVVLAALLAAGVVALKDAPAVPSPAPHVYADPNRWPAISPATRPAADPAPVSGSTVQVGNGPAAASYDPSDGYWFVANGGSNTASVLRANDSVLIATVPVGAAPTGVTTLYNATAEVDEIWLANGGDDTVSVLQVSDLTVSSVITVGGEPQAICYAPELHEAFVPNLDSDNVSVVSVAATPAVLGNISLGYNPSAPDRGWGPAGCAMDVDSNELFLSATYGSQVDVIGVGDYSAPEWLANVSDVYSPESMALAPSPYHETFVADEGASSVTVVSHHDPQVVTVVQVGNSPIAAVYDNVTASVYVSNSGSNTASVLSAASNTVTATLGVGLSPGGAAFDPADGLVLVTNSEANTVTVLCDGSGGTNLTDTDVTGLCPTGGGGPSPFPVSGLDAVLVLLGLFSLLVALVALVIAAWRD